MHEIPSKKRVIYVIECPRECHKSICSVLACLDTLANHDVRWNTIHVAGSQSQKDKFISKIIAL